MYLPLFVSLEEKKALVIGAGEVGKRRARKLRKAGAEVTVIDKNPIEIQGVQSIRTELKGDDIPSLENYSLVVVATDDRKLNAAVTKKAKEEGVLINRADDFRDGNLMFPATANTESGIISVSTSGTKPQLAKKVKELIENELSKG